MPAWEELALFFSLQEFECSFKLSLSSKYKYSGLTEHIWSHFDEKSLSPIPLKMKSITLSLTILTYFSKIDKNLVKNTENVNKINLNIVYYSQNFKPR